MTRRQQLIGQMRAALNQLERPLKYGDEDNEVVEFTIADTDFCFEEEYLKEKTDDGRV